MALDPIIRRETSADYPAIRDVVAAAFESSAEADLVEAIRASPEYLPALAMVAELDGRVVGHVMVSTAMLRHARGVRPIAMLSPLAVSPDVQRRGVGRALIEAVADAADRRGEPFIVLEGSPVYYGASGFEPTANVGMTMPLPDWAPPEAAQLRRLSTFDERDPTLRGSVVYPAAFDGLD